ncbi:MAG TPA: TonB-dependent receptor, partial [Sphingomonas sp.]
KGVELALTMRPTEGFTIQGSYSFIDTENLTPGADFGNDLARRPRQSASVSADYRFGFGLSIGGTVSIVGDSFDNAANTTRLDGYALAGIRAEMPVTHNVSIYGRVDNLFDEKYETVAGYGTYGRAAYGGIRLRFE